MNTTKLYRGRAITRLFPSGYWEIYSEGRFVKYDDLSDAKAHIDADMKGAR